MLLHNLKDCHFKFYCIVPQTNLCVAVPPRNIPSGLRLIQVVHLYVHTKACLSGWSIFPAMLPSQTLAQLLLPLQRTNAQTKLSYTYLLVGLKLGRCKKYLAMLLEAPLSARMCIVVVVSRSLELFLVPPSRPDRAVRVCCLDPASTSATCLVLVSELSL